MTTTTSTALVQQLTQLALSLTTEQDHTRLLERIMDGCIAISNSDAGTLYTINESNSNLLDFTVIRNHSLNTQSLNVQSIELFKENGKSSKLVVTETFLDEATINIPDAYACNLYDFSGTQEFDKQFNYHSKSFLCLPLKDHEGAMIGVLQLINAQSPEGEVITFSAEIQTIIESIASLAATALTQHKLIESQLALLESFIIMIARAIDHKSPVTGKHCENVPTIALMLAEAVNVDTGVYHHQSFSPDEMYELKISAWLHDCGKITTPEHIIDKATKLQTIFDRFELIQARFFQYKQHIEIQYLKSSGRITKQQFHSDIAAIDADLAFIELSNQGQEFLADECIHRIRKIGDVSWQDSYGETHKLLSQNEVENLSIRKGTLTDSEIQVMRDHIVITIDMLEALPYPRTLSQVPEIAGSHHECMNGKGYPRGLTGEQMSLRARIMCIADIFEALTAPDRPYKKGMPISQALSIMGKMVENNQLDRNLFNLFVYSETYLHYAEKHMNQCQIDTPIYSTIPGLDPRV